MCVIKKLPIIVLFSSLVFILGCAGCKSKAINKNKITVSSFNQLQQILNSNELRPGLQILLEPKTYKTSDGFVCVICNLKGTNENPVVIRSISNTNPAKLNFKLIFSNESEHVVFRDIEICNPLINRYDQNIGAIDIYGNSIKIINNLIHDVGHPGIGVWRNLKGGETYIYGNILYHIGNYPNSKQIVGSSIYAQSENQSVILENNISFRNLTNGLKVYTRKGFANNFTIYGNVLFDNGDGKSDDNGRNLFVSSETNPILNLKIYDNIIYRKRYGRVKGSYKWKSSAVSSATSESLLQNIEVSGNYFVMGEGYAPFDGAFALSNFRKAEIIRNVFVSPYTFWNIQVPEHYNLKIDNNLYYHTNDYYGKKGISERFYFKVLRDPSENFDVNSGFYDFSRLQSELSFEKNGTLFNSDPQDTTIIRLNKFDSSKCFVVIFNWSKSNVIKVNLSDWVKNERKLVLTDVQNPAFSKEVRVINNQITVDTNLFNETIDPIGKFNSSMLEIDNKSSSHTSPEFLVLTLSLIR